MTDPRFERTYLMIKPDGVQRGLVGEVITRLEKKGFRLIGLKLSVANKALLEEHYAEHKEKPFFKDLVDYMLMGPVVCMVWQGIEIVKTCRKMLGATNPLNSEPGTLRGDYCLQGKRNLIHGSDSVQSAEREIKLWFKEEEIQNYKRDVDKWIYEEPLP
jgi:nucleoside-diphosphate kinase